MSDLASYFLNSDAKVIQYDLLRISHPSFSQAFNLVRNCPNGITAQVYGVPTFFTYMPMRLTKGNESANLDQSIRVDLGDLSTVWPAQLDAIDAADTYNVKPTVVYWAFRSDDLASPLFGPFELEVTDFSFNDIGASFEAKAPRMNVLSTGELYTVDRFPTLRGAL